MAYGARLESVLGASPRGFESPILRHQSGTVRFRIFFMPYLGYRTKRVGFVVTFRLFGAEKSVLKLVGANLKDGQNVLVLWRLFGLLVRENPH